MENNNTINRDDLNEKLNLYNLSNQEVRDMLQSDFSTGLSSEEVDKRLLEFGRNILPKSKPPKWTHIFFKTFLDPLSLIMSFAGLVQVIVFIIAREITAPDIAGLVIILMIILTNSIIATIQEIKSLKQVGSLNKTHQTVTALRNGERVDVDVEELVPGDIIFANLGSVVPADVRIIDHNLVRIDESALTGENEPVKKIKGKLRHKELMLGDQKNIAFMSTLVVEGKLKGIVFATGKDSEIGKIASKITQNKIEPAPLEKKIMRFTAIIGLISILIGLIIFLAAFFISNHSDDANFSNWYTILLVSVSAAISVIPESLTIIVKICLTIAAKKMSKKNVIVKNPKSIETLGNVNVICSDKTGTLTENKMSVDSIFYNHQNHNLTEFDIKNSQDIVNCIVLCNDANVGEERFGSATELAILDFVQNYTSDYLQIRNENPRIDEIPFNSKRKMMTTVHQSKDGFSVYTKGAYDYVIKKCRFKLVDNIISPLTEDEIKLIDEQVVSYTKQGMRLLAFAKKQIESKKENYESDLIFLGCVAIIDPPRASTLPSIQEAKQGLIRVIMITGDHAITAFEIASRLGIADNQFNGVITGREIERSTNEELAKRLETTNVFARVNPEHKALIVDLLQKDNNIVAMTGDGVNDSPSLMKADVGISMGITGTDVAKEVSDTILSDDNFKSIISGINSGRNVYEKIKYSIAFLMSANISQVLTILIVLLAYQHLALNSVNILFHIFVVETIVAIPIGMQKERSGVMLNPPPSSKKENILKGILLQIIITTTFNVLFAVINYQIAISYTNDAEFAKAGVYMAIMLSPIFYAILFNNFFLPIKDLHKVDRYQPNKSLMLFMALAIALTAITLIPNAALNSFFDYKTIDMPVLLWVLFVMNSLLPTFAIYSSYNLIKFVQIKRTKQHQQVQQ